MFCYYILQLRFFPYELEYGLRSATITTSVIVSAIEHLRETDRHTKVFYSLHISASIEMLQARKGNETAH